LSASKYSGKISPTVGKADLASAHLWPVGQRKEGGGRRREKKRKK